MVRHTPLYWTLEGADMQMCIHWTLRCQLAIGVYIALRDRWHGVKI